MSDLVGNPEDRFSSDVAHMSHAIQKHVFLHMLKTNVQISYINEKADQHLCVCSSDSIKSLHFLNLKCHFVFDLLRNYKNCLLEKELI